MTNRRGRVARTTLLLMVAWWTSTAMMFVPATRRAESTMNSFHVFSSPGLEVDAASVLNVTFPVGMLERTTSTPLR